MTATRHLGRPLLPILIALILAGCGASTAPAASPAASNPVSAAAPSASASSPAAASNPVPSARPSAVPTPEPSATPEPIDSPEPTLAPTPVPTPLPGCGTGQAGFAAHASEVPRTLQFGGATLVYASAGIGMRDGTMSLDDEIPYGVGLTPDEIAVRVDPGTHIILRGSAVTLRSVKARAYPWSSVVFENDLASTQATPVELPLRYRSDGSVSVDAPTAPGDHMIEFQIGWQSACLVGSGIAFGRIKVN